MTATKLKICRGCFQVENEEKFTSVFEENGLIAKNIYDLAKVVIFEINDESLATICLQCLDELSQACEFRERLIKNHKKFLEIYSTDKVRSMIEEHLKTEEIPNKKRKLDDEIAYEEIEIKKELIEIEDEKIDDQKLFNFIPKVNENLQTIKEEVEDPPTFVEHQNSSEYVYVITELEPADQKDFSSSKLTKTNTDYKNLSNFAKKSTTVVRTSTGVEVKEEKPFDDDPETQTQTSLQETLEISSDEDFPTHVILIKDSTNLNESENPSIIQSSEDNPQNYHFLEAHEVSRRACGSDSDPDVDPTTGKYLCDQCDKTFNQKCHLTQHRMTRHRCNLQFKCGKCGKWFKDEPTLVKHVMKHNEDKPWKCKQCPKSFCYKADLKRHKMIHSKQKPHICDICTYGFIRHDHLLKHKLTHERKELRRMRNEILNRKK